MDMMKRLFIDAVWCIEDIQIEAFNGLFLIRAMRLKMTNIGTDCIIVTFIWLLACS